MHVLMLDDHAMFLQGLKNLLGVLSPGLQVDTSGDVAHAVQLAGLRAYDLVLLDWHLADCDGAEAMRRLREARIAERTDARCLALSLVWLRRTYLLAPFGLFGLFMGVDLGAPVLSSVWFALWTAHQVFVYRLAGRLQSQPATSPAVKLAHITRAFAIAGVLGSFGMTLLVVLRPSTDTLLLITLAISLAAGASITSSAGITRVYLLYSGPAYVVIVGAWLWLGGAMGYLLALLFATALPVSLAAIRAQRRGLAELVRLLDENQTLAEAITHERDRAQAASESKTRFFARGEP